MDGPARRILVSMPKILQSNRLIYQGNRRNAKKNRFPHVLACPEIRGAALKPRMGRRKVASGASPWTCGREEYQPRQGRQRAVGASSHPLSPLRPSGATHVLLDSHGLAPVATTCRPSGTCGSPDFWARPTSWSPVPIRTCQSSVGTRCCAPPVRVTISDYR
jgi:hypothetical protein